ncbi:Agmatinase [compost metagenome]
MSKLTVNKNVASRFSEAEDLTCFWNVNKGEEFCLEGNLLPILEWFVKPSDPGEVVKAEHHETDKLQAYIQLLVEEEILLPANEEIEKANLWNPDTFFNLPLESIQGALNSPGSRKGIILGIPFDLNVTNLAGSKNAPNFLRMHSKANLPVTKTDEVRLFDSMSVYDCGNISAVVPKQNGREQLQLEFLIEKMIEFNCVPICIGGDHSIVYSILRGMLKSKKINLIHLDAHYDYGNGYEITFEQVHHGNFLDGILYNDNLLQVIQVGQRARKDSRFIDHPKVRQLTVDEFCQETFNDGEYYITFDVDVLDPSILSGTGTPLPFGLDLRDIQKIMYKTRDIKIIGMDIVEFIPSAGKVEEALLINEILYRWTEMISKGSTGE